MEKYEFVDIQRKSITRKGKEKIPRSKQGKKLQKNKKYKSIS